MFGMAIFSETVSMEWELVYEGDEGKHGGSTAPTDTAGSTTRHPILERKFWKVPLRSAILKVVYTPTRTFPMPLARS